MYHCVITKAICVSSCRCATRTYNVRATLIPAVHSLKPEACYDGP